MDFNLTEEQKKAALEAGKQGVTAERAEICRDDSCLVLEPGHLSYSQKQPKTEMPPVIRKIRQGK